MDAIILAGGKGTRMDDATPKALAPVAGKTILAHQLDYLAPHVDTIILSLSHRAPEIIAYIQKQYAHLTVHYSIEDTPRGTGGGLKLALAKATSAYVLVLNCDDLTDINIPDLTKIRENTICAVHPQLPYGRIREHEGYVASFEEKPLLTDWVSCGWYVLNRDELLRMLPDNGSIEYDTFPKLKLHLYKHEGFWKALNAKKDIIDLESKPLPPRLTHNHVKFI